MARATLFNPIDKTRVAVDVGGQQARDLFAKGYKLETPTQTSATYSPNAPKQITQAAGSRDLYATDAGAGTSTKIEGPSQLPGLIQQGYQDTRTPFTTPSPPTAPFDSSAQYALAGNTTANSADSFKAAIASLLQKAQSGNMGNDDLMKQRNALINARFNAVNDVTPENLRVLSPSQQAALASGNASGLNDQLGGVNAAIQSRDKAAEQASQTLKDTMSMLDEQRKAAADDVTSQDKIRDDARSTIKLLWDQFGSDAFAKMNPADRSHYEKIAQFPQGTLDIASDTLAQQKLSQGNYKYVPPTKYSSGGVFDPKTGVLKTANGSSITGGPKISSTNRPSSKDMADPALAAWIEATGKLPPVNVKQRQDIVNFYKTKTTGIGPFQNPFATARSQVVQEKQTLIDKGLAAAPKGTRDYSALLK